jgi:hypothetical protein
MGVVEVAVYGEGVVVVRREGGREVMVVVVDDVVVVQLISNQLHVID